jgi:hypothetical protein
MAGKKIKINRAPVLTLWAAVVAERLGYDEETALTLGTKIKKIRGKKKRSGLNLLICLDEGFQP